MHELTIANAYRHVYKTEYSTEFKFPEQLKQLTFNQLICCRSTETQALMVLVTLLGILVRLALEIITADITWYKLLTQIVIRQYAKFTSCFTVK